MSSTSVRRGERGVEAGGEKPLDPQAWATAKAKDDERAKAARAAVARARARAVARAVAMTFKEGTEARRYQQGAGSLPAPIFSISLFRGLWVRVQARGAQARRAAARH
jgi:hypothetical protein